MGFISEELEKDVRKYISFERILLFIQTLDTDNPSLSEVARFLLRKYEENYDLDEICYLDDNPFVQNELTGAFIKSETKRPFYHFLKFVATFDTFDNGIDEGNPLWINYNQYLGYFLRKEDFIFYFKNHFGFVDWTKDIGDIVEVLLISNASKELGAVLENAKKESTEFNKEMVDFGKSIIDMYSENKQPEDCVAIAEEIEDEIAIIQQHRKYAPEFDALIKTLLHHAKEYDYTTKSQPLKKHVSITFQEKSGLSSTSRRPDEVARILGLPEENS